MSYCPQCGALLLEGARFCSTCGAAVNQAYSTVSQPVSVVNQPVVPVNPYQNIPVYTGDGYAVMLVDCGSCSTMAVANLLSDVCGYTDADAMKLAFNTPTLIAQNLNDRQAAYLAQSLTEYGAQAAIYDRMGNRTLMSDVDSVFDRSGSLLTKVAAAFGLIGIGNRITHAIRRLTLPSRPTIYTIPRPAPRPVMRRHIVRHPAPMPHVQPPRPAPVVHHPNNMQPPRPNNMQPPRPNQGPQHMPHQPGHPQDFRGGPGGPGNQPPRKK